MSITQDLGFALAVMKWVINATWAGPLPSVGLRLPPRLI
jgi:hypothetical protein